MALATPTPNLAPVEELFTQALAALDRQHWTTAIDTLIGLRAKNATFRAVEVDGMFYNAFRNRGVQRIGEQGLLEEGIYDMSRAERFGPLDRDAGNWRSWAELYLEADSYMGLNWARARTVLRRGLRRRPLPAQRRLRQVRHWPHRSTASS